MTYQTQMGGAGSFGGFGYYGLGATYTIGSSNSPVRTMQHELQRLNFLQSGTDRFGADGRWGPRTANALQSAARYVGYEDAAYTPSNADQLQSGSVTVPDDLLDRLRAASPAPPGTPGSVSDQSGGNGTSPVDPMRDDGEMLVTATATERSNWVPAAVIGGGVILMGAYMWYQMKPKRVRANRKRRSSRRR
jgi:peptidoglycan hydrolase-like protein with peptidoglycan-binding domain